jgi:hypothetical protein
MFALRPPNILQYIHEGTNSFDALMNPPPYSPFWNDQDSLYHSTLSSDESRTTIRYGDHMETRCSLARPNNAVKLLLDFTELERITFISLCHKFMFRLLMSQNEGHYLTFLKDDQYGNTQLVYTVQVHPNIICIQGKLT